MPDRLDIMRTLLNRWVGVVDHCDFNAGVCCCGEPMEGHSHPMSCGHSPVDMGAYHVGLLLEETRAVLGEAKDV